MLFVLLLVSLLPRGFFSPTPPLESTTPFSPPAPEYGSSTDVPSVESTSVISTRPPRVGCPKCDPGRCPLSVRDCSLNTGLVRDHCECCVNGICGLRENAQCFSENLAGDLPADARALGACGLGMECVLRTDLDLTDNPEALCACIEAGPVCGTDNRTHSSSCHLSQEMDSVWVKYHGPCRASPWIMSPPDAEVSIPLGASVSLSCESKGYPTPRLHWERVDVANQYDPFSHLPNDDSAVSVQLRGGPEPFMGSAWLQILATTRQHNGSYACVAVNTEGEARAIARIKVTSISEDPDAG